MLYLILDVLKDALRRFFKNGGFFLAAAVAFFGTISIFPLLLLGFSLLILFFRLGVARFLILTIANEILPSGSVFLKELLGRADGAVNAGAIGIAALIYAGMSVFGALQYALDRSFECKARRSYARFMITALAMSATTGGIIMLAGVFRYAIEVARDSVYTTSPALSIALSFTSLTVVFVVAFAIVTLIYTYVPRDKLRLREVMPGSLFASAAVFIAQVIFSIALRHTTLPFIFGSLTAIVALLIWLDITAILIIFGAEIAAAWMERKKHDEGRAVLKEGGLIQEEAENR